MPQINAGTILRLLLASLVVGMVMAFFHITPHDIWRWFADAADDFAANAVAWLRWGFTYILLGAVIVIPIWALSLLFRTVRRR